MVVIFCLTIGISSTDVRFNIIKKKKNQIYFIYYYAGLYKWFFY